METARFLPVQICTISQGPEGNVVFVRAEGSNLALPVVLAETEIQNILIEMTRVLTPHPLVSVLLLSAIESLHGRLERVEIYGIRGDSFLCRLVILQNEREILLESCTADALCLAVRSGCPVSIENEIYTRNSVFLEPGIDGSGSFAKQKEAPAVMHFLERELQDALRIEEYERAAILRDRIDEMKRGS